MTQDNEIEPVTDEEVEKLQTRVLQLEAEREEVTDSLRYLVEKIYEVHRGHAPHDGKHTCLRCLAERVDEDQDLHARPAGQGVDA